MKLVHDIVSARYLCINVFFSFPDSDSDSEPDDYEDLPDMEEEEGQPAVLHGRACARLCPRHKRKVRCFQSALNSNNYDAIPALRQDIR